MLPIGERDRAGLWAGVWQGNPLATGLWAGEIAGGMEKCGEIVWGRRPLSALSAQSKPCCAHHTPAIRPDALPASPCLCDALPSGQAPTNPSPNPYGVSSLSGQQQQAPGISLPSGAITGLSTAVAHCVRAHPLLSHCLAVLSPVLGPVTQWIPLPCAGVASEYPCLTAHSAVTCHSCSSSPSSTSRASIIRCPAMAKPSDSPSHS